MSDIESKIGKIETKEKLFQITTIIEKKPGEYKIPENLKIMKGNLYVYIIDQSVMVYSCINFKLISILKLPFKPLLFEITENNTMILAIDYKIYYYKYNLKNNKITFMQYIENIYHFCYLQKRKEILLLTENEVIEGEQLGMAKTDLLGNIIFYYKKKPTIYFEYKAPKPIDTQSFLWTEMSDRYPKNFSQFDGFNKDKYIFYTYGYTFNWYEKDEKYTLEIYSSDNLKKLYSKEYLIDMRYKKITDILFKKLEDDKNLFYYNEKENIIKFINIVYKGDHFYLNNYKFSYFDEDNKFLYIIDLSNNYGIKKIKINDVFNKNYEIGRLSHLCYYNLNGKEYLIYCSEASIETKDKYKFESKIVNGIIL